MGPWWYRRWVSSSSAGNGLLLFPLFFFFFYGKLRLALSCATDGNSQLCVFPSGIPLRVSPTGRPVSGRPSLLFFFRCCSPVSPPVCQTGRLFLFALVKGEKAFSPLPLFKRTSVVVISSPPLIQVVFSRISFLVEVAPLFPLRMGRGRIVLAFRVCWLRSPFLFLRKFSVS